MPIKKLTGAVIQRLKANPDGSRAWYWDASYKGLCLRVGRRDKTWLYYYRINGKQRNQTLGKYARDRVDHLDRESATTDADQINQWLDQGKDPKNLKKLAKTKPTVVNPNSLEKRVEQFLKLYKHEVKQSTYNQAKRLLEGNHLESYKQTDVSTISRAQLVELLEDMDDTPAQANRLHAYLNKFFTWCWDREYCNPSPMVGLKKRFREKKRKRYLTHDEIKTVWNACLELGYPLGDWARFTLVTGQRPGECRNLSRNDIYADVWLVEGGDPKNDQRHRIPLPKLARKIIEGLPKFKEPYLFTTTGGKKPITQGGKPYKDLYDKVGIEQDWRPHDFRRTFQTHCSEELDIEPYLLGAIQNQISISKPGVASVYNQAKWMKPKKQALEAWNRYIEKLVKKK